MSKRSAREAGQSRVRAYVLEPMRQFLRTEASGGAVLLAFTIAALAWANGWSDSYNGVWDRALGPGPYRLTLHGWVADGLMTVFFFVVGLEIKRELSTGELRDPRKAALPVLAAVGGMAGPALIYFALNAGQPDVRGWGIPVATDIAFALGVLAILGRRIPDGLKVFLLALAIADDVGGIVVIAAFYTDQLSLGWLGMAAAALGLVAALRRLGVSHPLLYLPLGVLAWVAMFRSGVHATIAGVALGLLTPAQPFRGRYVLEELLHRLHPISSYAIVPLFALASAGVVVDASALRAATDSTVFWGIVLGLFAGKLGGISLVTALAVGLRAGRLPDGVRGAHVLGVSAVAGTGFTLALFMAELAFDATGPIEVAKIGILAGSVLSAVVGAAILWVNAARSRPTPDRARPDPPERTRPS